MTRARGNKTTKAVREQRIAEVIPKLEEGLTVTQAAVEQGVHRTTLHRNLRALTLKLAATNLTEHQARVQAQEAALLFIEESLLEEKVSPEVANAWRSIRADLAKLRGLNAESRSLVAHVSTTVDDPRTLGRYRRFFYETRHLSDEDLEKVYAFCRPLNVRPPTRLISPPTDSPLWHDEEEPKQLAEGEPDEV